MSFMTSPHWPSKFFFPYRIEILMWAFVAELLVSPLADTHARINALLGLAPLLIVLCGIGYMANRAIVRRLVFPVGVIWMVVRIIAAFGKHNDAFAMVPPVLGLALSCSILWAIFDHFRSEANNPRSAMAKAFISYLVIATAFGRLYWILNRFIDHAFTQPVPANDTATFLYVSMATLTGIGAGPIAPLSPYVRIVASLESMSGIFFIAVVVARLVASYKPGVKQHDEAIARERLATTQMIA